MKHRHNRATLGHRFALALSDDAGFVLRGVWALALLGVMFVGALAGGVPWLAFALTLVVSLVLTLLSSAISGARSSRDKPTPTSDSGSIPSPAQSRRDPLAERAAELGRQYVSDVSALGNDAVAILRAELESSFGTSPVAERWPELLRLLQGHASLEEDT